jgi:hypothetical protein
MTNQNDTPRWFFDLDRTLYNTEALYDLVRKDLSAHGHTNEEVNDAKKALDDYTFEGLLARLGYSPNRIAEMTAHFQRHFSEGNNLLMGNVTKTLRRISETDECHLLTFGDGRFQKNKYAGLTDLHPFFHETRFISLGQTKGDILRDAGEGIVYFVDDAPYQLIDVHEKAPWVTLIRMMWPTFELEPHPEDGRLWRVITSIEELI